MDNSDGSRSDRAETERLRAQIGALRNDLQHTSCNLLGRIRSIVRQTSETGVDVEDFVSHLEGRLNALTRVQNWLLHDRNGADLELLIAGEFIAYRAREGAQFSLLGPSVRVPRKVAESLTIAFHELATNALKFGALSAASGHVAITWHVEDRAGDAPLVVAWHETGGPPLPLLPPSHEGFGTSVLLKALPYEISATTTLNYRPDGLSCTIVLPVGAFQ